MKRLDPPVDKEEYSILDFQKLSEYERNKSDNNPDAFSLTPQDNGFDKVTYYKKNLL
jgi:hypothetical protein